MTGGSSFVGLATASGPGGGSSSALTRLVVRDASAASESATRGRRKRGNARTVHSGGVVGFFLRGPTGGGGELRAEGIDLAGQSVAHGDHFFELALGLVELLERRVAGVLGDAFEL